MYGCREAQGCARAALRANDAFLAVHTVFASELAPTGVKPDASVVDEAFAVLMRYLSEILLQEHDIESFAELVAAVRKLAAGERFLHMDIKPPYFDTPENWQDVLEAAFTGVADARADDRCR